VPQSSGQLTVVSGARQLPSPQAGALTHVPPVQIWFVAAQLEVFTQPVPFARHCPGVQASGPEQSRAALQVSQAVPSSLQALGKPQGAAADKTPVLQRRSRPLLH
jgi:hypothetical protein